jgi:hypothetical protein
MKTLTEMMEALPDAEPGVAPNRAARRAYTAARRQGASHEAGKRIAEEAQVGKRMTVAEARLVTGGDQ